MYEAYLALPKALTSLVLGDRYDIDLLIAGWDEFEPRENQRERLGERNGKRGFWAGVWGSFIIFIASYISPIIILSVSCTLTHSFFHHFPSSHSWHLIHFSSFITFLISATFHLASFIFSSFRTIIICHSFFHLLFHHRVSHSFFIHWVYGV